MYNDEITSCWKIRIVKFAGSAPKSFTRQVFRLLRVIRLLRDVLSGSCETAGMELLGDESVRHVFAENV